MTRALHILVLLAIVLTSSDAFASWTRVRDMVHEADRISDVDKRIALLRKAYAEARETVRRSPRESNAFLWLANSAGRLAQAVGMNEKLNLAKVVKESAEKAVALDPKNGAAHMTLGAWHFYVADVSWVERNAAKALFGELPSATYETAIDHLTKALTHGVENPIEARFLRGRAFAEIEDDAKATADFRTCMATPARNDSEKRFQGRARKRIE